jgi:acetamidase/formamidase
LCQEYIDTLLQWSDELNILLLGVLHINKGDGKVRGHLGSELKNKCDFIVNVAKDENKTYTVSNPTCRYGEWPTFYFTRDEQGFPVYQKPATDVPF